MANPDPAENSDFDEDNEEIDINKNIATGIDDNFNVMRFSKRPVQISIVGRPNCGKSTLVNALLQEERMIIHELPGTTRDSISVQWAYKGKKIILVDTAGIEKSFNTTD